MQNKANLLDAQMNVSSVLTTDYENKSNWTLGENKPNSNPIKPNFRKAKMNASLSGKKDCEKESRGVFRKNKPKQSQFQKSPNEHKPLWKKGLRKRIARSVPQKQTQTKPISDYPCVFESAVYNLVLRDGNPPRRTQHA